MRSLFEQDSSPNIEGPNIEGPNIEGPEKERTSFHGGAKRKRERPATQQITEEQTALVVTTGDGHAYHVVNSGGVAEADEGG